ncbi:hypothetical protein BT69DRAFT_1270841, partial [Atractiella rhizophila]
MYLHASFFGLFLTALSLPPQRPFSNSDSPPLRALSEGQWDLTKQPHRDDTSAFAFDTISNLLQHWPNTRLRNGHNIVPGLIKPGTILYHGADGNTTPTVPEWFAFAPEHSSGFARQGWHLTIVVERPIKCLYFDGSSGAKMPYGSLDTQDLIQNGGFEERTDERRRIRDICAWGKKRDVEAFVRTEQDFEIMLCDPSSPSVKIVSWQQLPWILHDRPQRGPGRGPGGPGRGPGGPGGWPPPPDEETFVPNTIPDFPPRFSFSEAHTLETINAGSRHNTYPGNENVELFLSHLVSFYDTERFPSLIESRRGRKRMDHRLIDLSKEDINRFQNLSWELAWEESGGRVDWRRIIRSLKDRHYRRLTTMKQILFGSSKNLPDDEKRFNLTVLQAHVTLAPYLFTLPTLDNVTRKEWIVPAWQQCSFAHTAFLPSTLAGETKADRFIKKSVEVVETEICRVASLILAEGAAKAAGKGEAIDKTLDIWREQLRSLFEWLDWSEWVVCEPECSVEEICYLPTWPYFRGAFGRGEPEGGPDQSWWYPKPTCIRKFEPY